MSAPAVRCGVVVSPGGRRCMRLPHEHFRREGDGDHVYESLGVPCRLCGAAIYWIDGEFRDTDGGTGHAPDPRYVA